MNPTSGRRCGASCSVLVCSHCFRCSVGKMPGLRMKTARNERTQVLFGNGTVPHVSSQGRRILLASLPAACLIMSLRAWRASRGGGRGMSIIHRTAFTAPSLLLNKLLLCWGYRAVILAHLGWWLQRLPWKHHLHRRMLINKRLDCFSGRLGFISKPCAVAIHHASSRTVPLAWAAQFPAPGSLPSRNSQLCEPLDAPTGKTSTPL